MPLVPAPATLAPDTAPALADAHWLRAQLDHVRVIDTRRTADFLGGHVPGACSFPLDALLVEDTTHDALDRLGRAAQAALAVRGIGPNDHVVLVDDADGSAALGAAVCELAGVHRTTVIHGGMGEWLRADFPVASVPEVANDTCVDAWADTTPCVEAVASFGELLEAVRTGTAVVVDTRSQLEHEGIIGAQCCAARGCVPGSVHVEWTAFFDMSGTPRSIEHVRSIADHLGIDPTDSVIVTCHAGHRAAIATRLLRAAGYDRARVSLGSWHEWSVRIGAATPDV